MISVANKERKLHEIKPIIVTFFWDGERRLLRKWGKEIVGPEIQRLTQDFLFLALGPTARLGFTRIRSSVARYQLAG